MLDHTVERLRELETSADPFRTTDRGPLGKIIAEHRDALAADAEQAATAAGAPIHTARGIMRLFDVLVGITLGTLDHAQGYWHTVIAVDTVEAPEDAPRCGTYRCVAGWLAHLANPGAEAVITQHMTGAGYVQHRAEVLKLTDGTMISYDEAGARAVDVTITRTPCACGMERHVVMHHPIESLFDGNNTLTDLWTLAEKYTGGALTIPADLVPVAAAQTSLYL